MAMRPPLSAGLRLCALALILGTPVVAEEFTAADLKFTEEPVSGEVDVRAELRTGAAWNATSVARIVFSYQDAANYLYVQAAASGTLLGEVRAGADDVLATHAGWPTPLAAGVHQLTIKRRAWSIRVVCDRETILTAYDDFSPGDRIGSAGRGVEVTDLHTQPIGEMMFSDDFARPPGEPDPWTPARGTWQIRLPESRNLSADPVKTANPFSYVATGGPALSVAGSSYWDGYQACVAVKPTGQGLVGVAFYVQDPANYLLFRVPVMAEGAKPDAAKAELVRVVAGVETVLAEHAGAVATDKWCELSVRAHDGRLEGLLDGATVCRAQDGTFGQGQLGLYMDKCTKAYFDDVLLRPYQVIEDDCRAEGGMPVDQVLGTWVIYQERLCGRPEQANAMAIGLTGSQAWQDYCASADILPWTAGAAGLYFGCTSARDYYLFRWGQDRTTRGQDNQELWQVVDGKGTLLAGRPVPMSRATTYHVQATLDRDYVSVSVDGVRVLEAVDTGRASRGRVGYYVEGSSQAVAAFDNLQVRFLDPPAEPVSITEQFAREDTMADWARPLASWQALKNRLYAYDLPAWGDFDLRIRLSYMIGRAGTIGLRLAATPADLEAASDTLRLVTEKDSPELQCKVAADRGVSGKARPDDEDPLLEVERRGACLIARLDGKLLGWARAADGATAPTVGLKLDGMGVNLNNATLTSPCIVDAAFAGAPTQWRPQAGVWEISDRWNCQPQWGWFCGRQAETPLIWSKQSFSGDMVFEFWAGVMMDLRGGPGYSHPSDLNGVICGDGEKLCSGYAFVFAGDNNTRSKILRLGESVAETTDFKFTNPISGGDLNAFHRHWFHCRVERTGSHLTFLIDDRKALEYDDPNPLSGGHVGFWTHQNNGIMIARTRIAYKNTGSK